MMMTQSSFSSFSSRRGTPSSRSRKVRGGGGVSIKPGSQPESEESHASSSEHSDNEDEGSKVRNQVLYWVEHNRKQYFNDVKGIRPEYSRSWCALRICTQTSHCGILFPLSSLIPRPCPAFRCFQYGKVGRAWHLFSHEHDVIRKW